MRLCSLLNKSNNKSNVLLFSEYHISVSSNNVSFLSGVRGI